MKVKNKELNEIPEGWEVYEWGDLATLEYGDALKENERNEGPYPVFGTNGQIDWHDDYLTEGPGVIVGRKGAYRGVEYTEKPFFVIDTAFYLDADTEKVDMKWAYYQLKDFDINNLQSGSAIPSTSRQAFNKITVKLPPLKEQKKIAQILSAFDDLIENNKRRIEILEGMAEAIYREWFVNYNFPGSEDFEMKDSDLGPIPENFDVEEIGEVTNSISGGTPKTNNEEYWEDGDITWYTPSDLTDAGTMFMNDSDRHINENGLENSGAKMFPAYSVMMTSRATLGVLAINTTPACTNQGFINVVPEKQLGTYYIYHWLKENRDDIINLAGGSTYKELRITVFRELEIPIPPQDLLEKYERKIETIGSLIEKLLLDNRNLRETRNLLLPRLISGDIKV